MSKVNLEVLKAVQNALDRYETEVRATSLADSSQDTYIYNAQCFVRWLDDDFEPGATLEDKESESGSA